MSAEINPQHPGATLPNPHAGENKILLWTGGLLLLMALVALTLARLSVTADLQQSGKLVAAIVAAVVMLLAGGRLLAKAFKQLRFVFVMESLAPLADLIQTGEKETSITGERLRDRLRNNQPILLEPTGAFDGLLFKLVPAMSQTPRPLVVQAVFQFFNGLVLAATLLTFGFALIGSSPESRSWTGAIYLAVCVFVLVAPIVRSRSAMGTARIGSRSMILLLVGSAIVPPLLGIFMPFPMPGSEFIAYGWQATLMMVAGLLGSTLFVLALRALTQPPPITDIARAQRAIDIHTTPNQIFTELEREMMTLWVNRMPNRAYIHTEPTVRGERGEFTGELIEETMPQPHNTGSMGLSEALNSPSHRGVVWLDFYGAAAAVLGAALLLAGLTGQGLMANALIAGFTLIAVGLFCLEGANKLWRRFEFQSRIYWVEAKGTYQRSRADFGAQFHGEVRTSRETTFVEAMTLRVWCAEITSIAYDLKQARYLVHISGHQPEAERLLQHLTAQVMPLGGEASRAIEKVTALKLAREQQQLHSQLAVEARASAPVPAAPVHAPPALICVSCQQANPIGARFCEHCGQPQSPGAHS